VPSPARQPPNAALSRLRAVALAGAVIGGTGSAVLMIRAGQRTPRFLLVMFIVWLLAPFAVLLWANAVSPRWTSATRIVLYGVTVVASLASLAIYGELVDIRPPGAANAFPWVIVPPATMLLALTIPLAASIARRRGVERAD